MNNGFNIREKIVAYLCDALFFNETQFLLQKFLKRFNSI